MQKTIDMGYVCFVCLSVFCQVRFELEIFRHLLLIVTTTATAQLCNVTKLSIAGEISLLGLETQTAFAMAFATWQKKSVGSANGWLLFAETVTVFHVRHAIQYIFSRSASSLIDLTNIEQGPCYAAEDTACFVSSIH